VQIHGFVSQGYLKTTENNIYGTTTTGGGTFDLNEVGINFTASPIDRLRVGAQIFAQNVGKYGEGKPSIDWAYGEYQMPSTDVFSSSIAAGRVKTNHGLYNDYRDLDMTRTNVFLPEAVYSTAFRDFFIAVNGVIGSATIEAGALGSFHGHAYVGGQTVSTDSAIADEYRGAGVSSIDGIHVKRADGGGVEWVTPVEGLRFKGSVHHVNHMIADATTDVVIAPPAVTSLPWQIDLENYVNFIAGGEFQVGNLTIASEYSNAYYKAVFTPPGQTETAVHNRTQGAYLNGSYRFLPKWEGSLMGTWSYAVDDSKPQDSVYSFRRGAVIALRFDPTEHWLIKAEFQRNRGTLGVAPRDNPDGTSEYWNEFALKTTYDF